MAPGEYTYLLFSTRGVFLSTVFPQRNLRIARILRGKFMMGAYRGEVEEVANSRFILVVAQLLRSRMWPAAWFPEQKGANRREEAATGVRPTERGATRRGEMGERILLAASRARCFRQRRHACWRPHERQNAPTGRAAQPCQQT